MAVVGRVSKHAGFMYWVPCALPDSSTVVSVPPLAAVPVLGSTVWPGTVAPPGSVPPLGAVTPGVPGVVLSSDCWRTTTAMTTAATAATASPTRSPRRPPVGAGRAPTGRRCSGAGSSALAGEVLLPLARAARRVG
jgi:hypothetical protein